MNVRLQTDGDVLTASILGDIDHHSARHVREAIDYHAESARPRLLLLDFKDVTFMDSSGIGLVMGRYKLMKSIGGETRVANASGRIAQVMRLAGLDKLGVLPAPAQKEVS